MTPLTKPLVAVSSTGWRWFTICVSMQAGELRLIETYTG
jgi:hypothetical protein